jgi:hypothetical protein
MSDHFSGPRAIAGPAGDISDIYAFPSPERPDHLMLVMNVLPLPDLDAFFSDAIVNRFRLRPLTIEPDGPAFPYGPEDSEPVFSFSFEAPQSRDGGAPVQDGWCTSPSGARTRFRVHDDEGGRGDGLQVYAGLRSDPFFIDLPAFLGSVENDELAFRDPGENSLTNANALGLVVEVDRELLQRGGGPLFGVVSCSPASRSSDLTRSGRRAPCVPIARRTRSSRTRDAGSSCDASGSVTPEEVISCPRTSNSRTT